MSRRYFFAYHDVFGTPFPFAWVEEYGLCVGGRPDIIPDTKVEISAAQFAGGLLPLEKEFPLKLPELTLVTKSSVS